MIINPPRAQPKRESTASHASHLERRFSTDAKYRDKKQQLFASVNTRSDTSLSDSVQRWSIADRFLAKVSPEPNTGCWLWLGSLTNWGYGTFWFGGDRYGAHRFSYWLHVDVIPEGLFVLHHCDVPSCVNPQHLRVGTQQQNMEEMALRGRAAHQKIRASDIAGIFELRLLGFSQQAIADRLNVNQSIISDILGRRKNRHALSIPLTVAQ